MPIGMPIGLDYPLYANAKARLQVWGRAYSIRTQVAIPLGMICPDNPARAGTICALDTEAVHPRTSGEQKGAVTLSGRRLRDHPRRRGEHGFQVPVTRTIPACAGRGGMWLAYRFNIRGPSPRVRGPETLRRRLRRTPIFSALVSTP